MVDQHGGDLLAKGIHIVRRIEQHNDQDLFFRNRDVVSRKSTLVTRVGNYFQAVRRLINKP